MKRKQEVPVLPDLCNLLRLEYNGETGALDPWCLKIPLSIQEECLEFVAAVAKTSTGYYLDKRKADALALPRQQFMGKLAEFATREFLHDNFHVPYGLRPDLNVYEGGGKSWRSDLPYLDETGKFHNIHVKSCRMWEVNHFLDLPYRESWVFQHANREGGGGRDDLYDHPWEYVSLVSVAVDRPVEGNFARIHGIVRFESIQPFLSAPYKKGLANIKQVFNKIPDLRDNLSQIAECDGSKIAVGYGDEECLTTNPALLSIDPNDPYCDILEVKARLLDSSESVCRKM